MKYYVVCMDASYVRDAQMFDTSELSDDEFCSVDVCSEEMEGHWHDIEPTPFVGITVANDAEDACRKMAEQYRYDARCLFAIEIG